MKRSLLLTALLLLCGHVTGLSQQVKPDQANIEYARVDTVSLRLDVYLPKGFQKPYPVIVWIHGGAWLAGSKENPPAIFMIPQGYAMVSINYRLSQQAIFPAQIHDCKGAIRWVRANATLFGFDPARVGVWGSSAGGHLVAMLGTSGNIVPLEGSVGGNSQFSSQVQAVCDWYGPSNLRTIADYPSSIDRSRADCPEARLIGGKLQDNPDKAEAASPIAYVSAGDPPFLIMHGTNDMTVPFHQSVELDSALRRAGIRSIFIPMVGSGHGGGGFSTDSSRAHVINFFNKNLRPATTLVQRLWPEQLALHLYPNPARGEATLQIASPVRDLISIHLSDQLGRKIRIMQPFELHPGDNRISLDLRGLRPGMYMVRVGTSGRTIWQQIRVLL